MGKRSNAVKKQIIELREKIERDADRLGLTYKDLAEKYGIVDGSFRLKRCYGHKKRCCGYDVDDKRGTWTLGDYKTIMDFK